MLPFQSTGSPAFKAMMSEKSGVQDAMASIIGHGLATRFPTLKFMPVEYWAGWIRPFVNRIQAAYEQSPVLFDEDPFEVLKRNVYIHIFHEPDPQGLLDLGLPADRLMFGSDFPHPEGLGDPLQYSEVVEGLTEEEQEPHHGRHHRQGARRGQVRELSVPRPRSTATPGSGRGSSACPLPADRTRSERCGDTRSGDMTCSSRVAGVGFPFSFWSAGTDRGGRPTGSPRGRTRTFVLTFAAPGVVVALLAMFASR
ncbi:MAG: hypothetical protein U0W40_03720 [Acidimicrobiia bacterium]